MLNGRDIRFTIQEVCGFRNIGHDLESEIRENVLKVGKNHRIGGFDKDSGHIR